MFLDTHTRTSTLNNSTVSHNSLITIKAVLINAQWAKSRKIWKFCKQNSLKDCIRFILKLLQV